MVRAFLSEKGKKAVCGGTTSQIVSRIAKKKPVGGATGFNEKRQDGATAPAKLLMNECTQVHFFAGKASKPAYRNPKLPLELNLKLRRIAEHKELLQSMGKSVTIDYY